MIIRGLFNDTTMITQRFSRITKLIYYDKTIQVRG